MKLGLAVDVETRDGARTLMVPVIRDAGRMPFARVLEAYADLVERAHERAHGRRRLSPESA